MRSYLFIIIMLTIILACNSDAKKTVSSSESESTTKMTSNEYFTWDNATVYFLLTDRFKNGDPSNDAVHDPQAPPAPYRGFMGGDIKGVTQKIKEGYFTKLGVTAIWTTPVLQQISGSTDEGTGMSYPFHGYWTRDWTAFDERFTSEEDYAEFVKTAHEHGIRVIMDVIVNHTGPVTEKDAVWPEDWVRTTPQCAWQNAETTIKCALVKNLPDIKTESTTEVDLPPFLVKKWKKEGRFEQEVKELDDFFSATGYPRRPYYYIIKWLVDYIEKYGIDGFRGDTVKHTEEQVWKDLFTEAKKAFAKWKQKHPAEVLDDNEFYMVGEVYNYFVSNGRMFDYGDRKVDFFEDAYHAMINFDFKGDANKEYETIFTKYDAILNGEMKGKSILNYVSSHDDSYPFDKNREKPIEAGTKLLLTQGGAQIYYGDETARSLSVKAEGDAVLRSPMNWDNMNEDTTKVILEHWQKLGQFRRNHPSIGAGRHEMISEKPYVFHRSYKTENYTDDVVIALDLAQGQKTISVGNVFENGSEVFDAYSSIKSTVIDGFVTIDSKASIVLLESVKN